MQDEPLTYPFGHASGLRPDPTYRELRDRPGLARVAPPYGTWAWLVTRHDEVRAVLEDRRFSRALASTPTEPRVTATALVPGSLLSLDPPEHTRLRRATARWLSRQNAERLRPRIARTVESLLDAVRRHGPPVDLMAAFARPLSATVIYDMLGVPGADRAAFHAWATARRGALWTLSPTGITEAGGRLRHYLTDLVRARRAEPGDDLLSSLIGPSAREPVSAAEAVSLGGVVLAGGSEITAGRIGSIGYALLTRPDLAAALRAEPGLVPQAVEELLRYTTLGARVRVSVAAEDIEVAGTLIRAGEAVMPSRCAANRDAAAFPDPDSIDLTRAPCDHVAFGHGPHYCTGAPLARVELQLAVEALLRTFPTLRLAVPAAEVRWGSPALWAPEELPVTW